MLKIFDYPSSTQFVSLHDLEILVSGTTFFLFPSNLPPPPLEKPAKLRKIHVIMFMYEGAKLDQLQKTKPEKNFWVEEWARVGYNKCLSNLYSYSIKLT